MSRMVKAQAAAVAAALAVGLHGAAASAQSASDLLARVVARQTTSGFTMRARLIIRPAGTGTPVTRQIRALGRQDAKGTHVLYQALWPDAVKGRAVIVDRVSGQPVQGFFFSPPATMTPITPAHMSEAVLDSDLTVEDLAEDFLWWPDPAFAGQDRVGGGACRLVESRPPSGVRSSYASIRSCVSESKLLIVRIEKVDAAGHVVKRFTVTKTARSENGAIAPRVIEIHDLVRGSTTTIDVSRGERDIVVARAEFSLARLKSLGR